MLEIIAALLVASLIHVFIESSRDRRIGNPWLHVGLTLFVFWPFSYLFWIFLWPGSLRQAIFGSDRERARKRARAMLDEDRRRC